MKVTKVMRKATCADTGEEIHGYAFKCPGCGEVHIYDSRWTFNGNFEAPTFMPSYLVKSGHYADNFLTENRTECWCTYAEKHPEQPAPFSCYICHSFVTDGKIQFLSDCTHALAGQTVEIPDTLEEEF